jgi:HTH-type transcriptional regulator/antitoxin HigA
MTTEPTRFTAYQELLVDYVPRPISSDAQYRRVLTQIDSLMKKRRPTRAEEDLLELLSTVVVQYEANTHPAPYVTPAKMLEHLIDARGVTRAQVARDTGIPQSTLTNILHGRRGISKVNADRLARYFHVALTAFIETAEAS